MNCCSTAPTDGEAPGRQQRLKRKASSRRTSRSARTESFETYADDLCSACYYGELNTVQRLVEKGEDPHRVRAAWTAPTGGYWVSVTPVWIASFQGRLPVVKYLVEAANVDIHQVGSFEQSTPIEAASDHWQCPGCHAALPAPDLRINPPSWYEPLPHWLIDLSRTQTIAPLLSEFTADARVYCLHHLSCSDHCGHAYLDTRSPPHQMVVSYLQSAIDAAENAAGGMAWSRQRPSTATAAETAVQLQRLKLTELRRKALAAGHLHERVDNALDSELPREALIALLLERRPVSAPSFARQQTAPSVEVEGVGLGEQQPESEPRVGQTQRLRQWRRERAARQTKIASAVERGESDGELSAEDDLAASQIQNVAGTENDVDFLTAGDEEEQACENVEGTETSSSDDNMQPAAGTTNHLRRRPAAVDTTTSAAAGSPRASADVRTPAQALSSPALIRALYADRSTDRSVVAATAAAAVAHDAPSPEKIVQTAAGQDRGDDLAAAEVVGGQARYQQYLKWAARMRGNRAPQPTMR